MKFIILVFLLYIGFKLFGALIMRMLSNKVRKSGMFGNPNPQNEPEENMSRKDKKKIVNKEAGEYVDFEEIDKNEG